MNELVEAGTVQGRTLVPANRWQPADERRVVLKARRGSTTKISKKKRKNAFSFNVPRLRSRVLRKCSLIVRSFALCLLQSTNREIIYTFGWATYRYIERKSGQAKQASLLLLLTRK